jgi:hypothetical protein
VPHDEQTHLTVDHTPGQHMAVHTEDAPDAKARQETARRVALLLAANPDLTVQDVAHAYAAVPDHDRDVLALLAYLSHQVQRIGVAGRA